MILIFKMTSKDFKEWRLKAELTQEDIGYLLGCHLVTISKMERGLINCPDIEYELDKLLQRAKIAKKILDRVGSDN